MKDVTAIAMFSGGLDSILACRVIMAQGIRVVAVKFVTPFFDDRLVDSQDEFRSETLRNYGIDARVVDLGEEYVRLLVNPRHGFGKHFNPCIDCKIFMLGRARAMMAEHRASFLISGEVLGQRPMSQRRDTLRVIERESGCEDILLRPLCAKLLPETMPERAGLVSRSELYALRGRGRKDQMQLAAHFGITEYPSPAGGCILTDPNLGERIAQFYRDPARIADGAPPRVSDIRLLLLGRQFRLPAGYWLVIGRNEEENNRLAALAEEEDWLLAMVDRPGPTGLLRRIPGEAAENEESAMCQLASGLIVRYGRKIEGRPAPGQVRLVRSKEEQLVVATPPVDDSFRSWQF